MEIFWILFSNLIEISVDLHNDPFVPIDPCHPAIQINVQLPVLQHILNNERTIFNYEKASYTNVNLFLNS